MVTFFTKPSVLGILSSTFFNFVFAAKLVILGILFSISVILLLKVLTGNNEVILDFVAKLVISGILLLTVVILPYISLILVLKELFDNNPVVSILSTFVFKALYSVFLTTSFFPTLLNLAKSVGTVFNFSTFVLSISVFKVAKFVFDAKLLTSTCVTFFKSVFVA